MSKQQILQKPPIKDAIYQQDNIQLLKNIVSLNKNMKKEYGQLYKTFIKQKYLIKSNTESLQQYIKRLYAIQKHIEGHPSFFKYAILLLFPIRQINYSDMKKQIFKYDFDQLWDDWIFKKLWTRQKYIYFDYDKKIINPYIILNSFIFNDKYIAENIHLTYEEKKQIFHLRRLYKKEIKNKTNFNEKNIINIIKLLQQPIIIEYENYGTEQYQQGYVEVFDTVKIYGALSNTQIENVVKIIIYVLYKYPLEKWDGDKIFFIYD
jgi:hypothetical protein